MEIILGEIRKQMPEHSLRINLKRQKNEVRIQFPLKRNQIDEIGLNAIWCLIVILMIKYLRSPA